MNQVTLIRQTLQPHLDGHGARVTFMALFLIALFRVKTVNLAELATAFVGKAQTESNSKRLQRFFSQFELNYWSVANLVVGLMNIPQPWVLSIDRTNWEFGACRINILMLGVVHQGVAFPLLWWMLDKRGNSNTIERIELLEEFFEVFPEVEVDYLTADREFLGAQWFEYLLEQSLIELRIRIRESDQLDDGRKRLKAKVVFSNLQVNQHQVLRQPRLLWGCGVYVAALRLEDGSLLVVVTGDRPRRAIADYAQRWGIEKISQFLGVEYLYEDLFDASLEPLPVRELAIAKGLASMPVEWLQELNLAAQMADEDAVLRLLDQIPAAQSALSNALLELVHDLRLDRLIYLTQKVE